ncbi:hypothetical protein ACIBL3_33780 [Kribbella sp. NPDC050124]|uniref:hypothetical protein n=1 Tax=Kribbella sp. NPDC050124 TaxID=3364114 RepID=UPI0037A567B6
MYESTDRAIKTRAKRGSDRATHGNPEDGGIPSQYDDRQPAGVRHNRTGDQRKHDGGVSPTATTTQDRCRRQSSPPTTAAAIDVGARPGKDT